MTQLASLLVKFFSSPSAVRSWLALTHSPGPSLLNEDVAMRTDRTRKLPLFFTQVIGSLPRPKLVQDLLARRHTIPAARIQSLLDDMVRFAIRLQEEAGIDVISDGEWRRTHYVGEFLERVGG